MHLASRRVTGLQRMKMRAPKSIRFIEILGLVGIAFSIVTIIRGFLAGSGKGFVSAVKRDESWHVCCVGSPRACLRQLSRSRLASSRSRLFC